MERTRRRTETPGRDIPHKHSPEAGRVAFRLGGIFHEMLSNLDQHQRSINVSVAMFALSPPLHSSSLRLEMEAALAGSSFSTVCPQPAL